MAFRKTEKSFKTDNRWTSKWPGNIPGLKRKAVTTKKTAKSKSNKAK